MKKRTLFLLAIILCLNTAIGQEDKSNKIFSEFYISTNNTFTMCGEFTKTEGFGLGIHHSFLTGNRFNILVGLEYNRTNVYIESVYLESNTYVKTSNILINAISIPAGIRLNSGDNLKVFCEIGIFADIILGSNITGIQRNEITNNTGIVTEWKSLDKTINLSNMPGIYFGYGFRFPFEKFEIVFKPDVKIGLNSLDNEENGNIIRNSYYYFRLSMGIRLI